MNQIVAATIDRVASNYARRLPWVDPDDLRQAAWLEVLEHIDLRKLDPKRAQFYVYRVVARRMSRYVWGESTPVSGFGHRHKPTERRAPLFEAYELGAETTRRELERREATKAEPAVRAQVRERVAELAQGTRYLDAVITIVIEGVSVWRVAKSLRVDRTSLGREANQLRARVRADTRMRELLRQLTELRYEAEPGS